MLLPCSNETPEDEYIAQRGKNLSCSRAKGGIAVVLQPHPVTVKFMKAVFLILALSFLIAGCASNYSREDPDTGSPTSALLRGDLTTDEYLEALTEANEASRMGQQFEMNREPTRAFNTRTNRIEYVPEGTDQRWNEDKQRWEFTPIE